MILGDADFDVDTGCSSSLIFFDNSKKAFPIPFDFKYSSTAWSVTEAVDVTVVEDFVAPRREVILKAMQGVAEKKELLVFLLYLIKVSSLVHVLVVNERCLLCGKKCELFQYY